jgi:hypothetical protein
MARLIKLSGDFDLYGQKHLDYLRIREQMPRNLRGSQFRANHD